MNERAEACRRNALACERKALEAAKDETRQLYHQLAGLWRDVARLTADRDEKKQGRSRVQSR